MSTDPENFKNATHPLRFLWNLVCLQNFFSVSKYTYFVKIGQAAPKLW